MKVILSTIAIGILSQIVASLVHPSVNHHAHRSGTASTQPPRAQQADCIHRVADGQPFQLSAMMSPPIRCGSAGVLHALERMLLRGRRPEEQEPRTNFQQLVRV